MTLKISHKQLARIGKKYSRQVVFFVSDMPKRMRKLAFEICILSDPRAGIMLKYMEEKLLAKCIQKKIFRFKMCVKGASSDVCFVNDILNGNMIVTLPFKQTSERLEDGFSRFLLSSVHSFPPLRNIFDIKFGILLLTRDDCCFPSRLNV